MERKDINPLNADSILVVHGRGVKPDFDSFLDLTSTALLAGVERDYPEERVHLSIVPIVLAYYGDLTNALIAEQGQPVDPVLDLGDRRNALQQLRSFNSRKRFNLRQYDRLPGKTSLPEMLADISSPLLGALGLTLPLISSVSEDFHEYLAGESDYKEQVRARVRAKVCKLLERGDRVLLITHGTGCVVAYDVLWQLSHDPQYAGTYSQYKIDTWLTLGAPLGDHFLQKRLLGAGRGSKHTFPTNIISWYNVSAEDDYTCHDGTIADDFRDMLRKHVVSIVKDYQIYNLSVRYGMANPHSSVGYYIHPRIAKIIVNWLNAPAL
jgi:hypothetical protein